MAAALRPDPLGVLKVPLDPSAFTGEQGNGEATAGRIKGGWEGWEKTKGRNERKERGVVQHPKLNAGFATELTYK